MKRTSPLHAVRVAIFVALVLTFSARIASAQVSADNRARAQQLFDSALADAEAGNFAAACLKFRASQEADPKTSTLLNLANCYEKNGQTASAWGAFREAEGAARSAGRADWESRARARAAALEPQLVKLTVRIEKRDLAGLVIERDGVRVTRGEWDLPIPVDPGVHEIVASAPDHEPFRTSITIRDQNAELVVPPLARLAAKDPDKGTISLRLPAPEPPSFWTPTRQWGAVVAGVGLVAAATGGVLGVVSKQNYDAAREQCRSGTSECPPSAVRDSNGAYDLAAVATITGLAGLGVALAGGALVALAPSPRARTAASLGIGPSSLVVRGRF